MAGAYVDQIEGSSPNAGVTTVSTSGSLPVTAGNFLFFVAGYFGASARTITWPTDWGTVVEAGNVYNGSDQAGLRWGYIKNAAAANAAAAITFSGACDYPSIYVAQFSGLDTTAALLATPVCNNQTNPGTGTNAVTVSFTLGSQPAFCVGLSVPHTAQNWDTAVKGTGLTRVWDYGAGSTFSGKPQYQRFTATGAQSLGWTTSAGTDVYYTVAIAVAEAGGGGGGVSKQKVAHHYKTMAAA